MQSQQPFKARNVRYDDEGNIEILLWYEEEECHAERSAAQPTLRLRSPSARSAQDDRASLETKHVVRSFFRSIHIPRPKISLPKFSAIRSAAAKISTTKNPEVRIAFASGRFAVRFTAIFLFLFVSLNARSYFQVGRAWLLPDADNKARRALQVMTDPLLSVPELPLAGRPSREGIAADLDITPPDNRLIIPKIGKNVPLISVTGAALKREDWNTFEKDIQDALLLGVVRYPGTATPGEVGNVFITGHSSNYPWILSKYNSVLARLPTLEVGDEYSLYYEGRLHRYRIAEKFEVSPKDVTVLEQPQNRRMSTLMTCTPIGTTLRRLILQADEVDPITGSILAVSEEEKNSWEDVGWGMELPI